VFSIKKKTVLASPLIASSITFPSLDPNISVHQAYGKPYVNMSSSSQGFERDDSVMIPPSPRDFDGSEEFVNLVYEPTIIKGKGGERLWHAEATKDCAAMCKLQLKVIVFAIVLMNRMNAPSSSLPLSKRKRMKLGLNSWKVLIRRRVQLIASGPVLSELVSVS
jgi:hypothetical protein